MMISRFFTKHNKQAYFWNWFLKNADNYFHFEQNQNILFTKLKLELEKINPNLTFEFSPILKDHTREFIISADGIKSIFPIVQDLVKQAPDLTKWKVIAFRQSHPEITQINYKELTVNLEDVYFQYEKENGRIGLELNIKGFFESPEWTGIVFILLDNVLGEFDTEMDISYINKKNLDETQKSTLFNIRELPAIIQKYKQEFYN
jgi:hypothetical protein